MGENLTGLNYCRWR